MIGRTGRGAATWQALALRPLTLAKVRRASESVPPLLSTDRSTLNGCTDPPYLLGVHCMSTDYEKFQELPGFLLAMADARLDRQQCEDVRLSWAQLENLRSKSSYTYTCDAGGTQGSSPGTPSGNDDDDNCPCSYSNKIAAAALSSAEQRSALYDADECELEEGGSCCGRSYEPPGQMVNYEFPGECSPAPPNSLASQCIAPARYSAAVYHATLHPALALWVGSLWALVATLN